MRIIPVLDLKSGQAVHAVAGHRDRYPPLQSILHASSDPIELARALRGRCGLDALYLADLDAIAGRPPLRSLYQDLADSGLDLWIDAGVRDRKDIAPLHGAGVSVVVLGLETLRGPDALLRCVRDAPRDSPSPRPSPARGEGTRQSGPLPPGGGGIGSRGVATTGTPPGSVARGEAEGRGLAFSLDLRDGRPLVATGSAWGTTDPLELAAEAVAAGLSRLIVLDLARVGTGQGPGTLPLLTALRAAYPDIELVAGGGIAGPDDFRAIERIGVAAVLIGSALHDGRLKASSTGLVWANPTGTAGPGPERRQQDE